jgi:hypothetical protein
MAIEYITIDTSVSGGKGSELRNAVNQVESARERLQTLKIQMEAMIDAGDYTAVETNFGVGTGNGQDTYNLVTGALTALNGTNLSQLIKRLG